MEISLEKIELVTDRTGVSYKEAKEALEKVEGNVVDAIIYLEENMEETVDKTLNQRGKTLVDKIKKIIEKGNVSRIVIRKNGEVILNLPVNVGIIGGVFATMPTIIAVIAAFGTRCDIEIVKDSGAVVDVSDMANEKFGGIIEKGTVIADEVKVKGADAYQMAKDKANDVIKKVRKTDDDEGCTFDEEVEVVSEDDTYEDSTFTETEVKEENVEEIK